ncbi:hypothetical protein MATL_G00078480 [Megalops atlanticus]|uniref:Transcriptional regulator n=1 Tax=Megalops atlanticus TaxID=7932 RepID=A0A9D3Q6R4_MEGAT|nr:hypothetical protein MATL_G00078480 [Megalops atlanticus]
MLQSFSPSHYWDYDSEPLLFDEEFCQSLMKDLQTLPTPPQSPPIKTGLDKPLSKVDQLELVSELLLEDQDFFHLGWNCDLNHGAGKAETGSRKDQGPEVSDDCLWQCLSDRFSEEKLSSVLSTSPLLSDIDTGIFEEIAGSTLDCHGAALECQSLQNEDFLQDSCEQNETSDYSSLSTGSDSSNSDSEEEIDVVTVRKSCASSQREQTESRRQPRAAKRCQLEIQQEIQLQHNYAAPCPDSPPRRPDASASSSPPHKRARTEPHHRHHQPASGRARQAAELEDEEVRRRTHNVMERQRRNELKNCFLRLRDKVPELSNNDKASKVVILKKARDSIRGLEAESLRLAAKKDKLRQRQEQLKARLEQLRR